MPAVLSLLNWDPADTPSMGSQACKTQQSCQEGISRTGGMGCAERGLGSCFGGEKFMAWEGWKVQGNVTMSSGWEVKWWWQEMPVPGRKQSIPSLQ